MSFSSGTYTLPAGNPVVTATTITSTWANTTLSDIATALSTCVLKDGTQTITANIPMSNFKFTGLAAGSAANDSVRLAQVQASAMFLLGVVAGTNTITATASPTLTAYSSGNQFVFIPANSNTAATTINIDGLGAKNIFWNGAACSGGELVISVPALIEYDGTRFNVLGPMIGTRLTNSLTGDVALNNVANYFDGPIVAQGTVGTWFASGTITLKQGSGATEDADVKLWDGTTVIASTGAELLNAAGSLFSVSLSGVIANPAGNIRISVKDTSSVLGLIIFNGSGNSKDSTITAIRIA